MAYEGAISSLGMLNMRNPDGSIDRSPPPTQSLWGILADIEAKCEVENLDIVDLLSNLGGNNRGMMKRNAFQTALKDHMPRLHMPESILNAITSHYGVGYANPRGDKENIAWADFAEDVMKADKNVPSSVWEEAKSRAYTKGKEPGSPDRPPPVRGWQPGDQTRADYTFGGTEEKTKEWFKAQPFPTLPGKATYA